MTEPAYRLHKVVRSRGTSFRLQIDSLIIPGGSVLSLLGPTGSGKTTLLRLLTGLERCDAGEINYGKAVLNEGAELATLQQIALVPQSPIMLRGTVRWNLEYGLRARRQLSVDRVESIARQLGIADLLGRNARSLSGGQTQLVALGRALVCQPKVLLLDEPTANLDPAYVATVERAVADLDDTKTTVVWSTHNLFQAKRVSQLTAFLLSGALVEVGPTAQFFDNPTDPRSRSFVNGEMIC